MTQTELNYAIVLYDLDVDSTVIEHAREVFDEVPMLKVILSNPAISQKKRESIVEKIFKKEIQNFLKMVTVQGKMRKIDGIWKAYDTYKEQKENIKSATLFYVTKPTEEQKRSFEDFIKKEFSCEKVHLTLIEKPTLLGGFLLKVGSVEYDNSLMGKLNGLRQQILG